MLRRILAALVIIALSATVLVLVWPQLFSLQRVAGIAQLVSFRGAAAAAAAVVFVDPFGGSACRLRPSPWCSPW